MTHNDRTLPSVSAPSNVVKSIIPIAASIAHAFDVVLIDRDPNPAARASAPTWSTPGNPCNHVVNEALVNAPTPSNSRARAVAVGELTDGVYPPMLVGWDVTLQHESCPGRRDGKDVMGTRMSTTKQVFRQGMTLALAGVSGVTGVLLLLSLARTWADNPQPLFAAWVLFGLALVWALFVRPAVVLGDDGVTIRNVLRDIYIPWAQVTRVESRWNLKVFVEDRGYTAWAIASQAERPRMRSGGRFAQPGRVDRHAGRADVHAPQPASKVTALMVAWAIDKARQEYVEALARGALAAAPGGRVQITWVPLVLAILVVSGLAVVAFSMT